MSSSLILICVFAYSALLFFVVWLTSRNADNESYFIGPDISSQWVEEFSDLTDVDATRLSTGQTSETSAAYNQDFWQNLEEEWKELRDVAALRSLEDLELIFQVLHHGVDWIARSPQPKVVLDVLLVKCATAEVLAYANAAQSPSTVVETDRKSAVTPSAVDAQQIERRPERWMPSLPKRRSVRAATRPDLTHLEISRCCSPRR